MAMAPAFVPFGIAHLSAIALAVFVPVALAMLGWSLQRNAAFDRAVRACFAALLIACWAFWLWLVVSRGWASVATLLPLNLSDWATAAAIVTLIRPNQRSYELAYFWAFGATLQALLTPDLAAGFPDPRFIVFFGFHSGVIAAVLYLTLATGMRPYMRSLPRVLLWSLGYMIIALAVNISCGTNFGFLAQKPPTASLMDWLSPWPFYIPELVLLGVAAMALCYAPFFAIERLRTKRAFEKP